MAQESSATGRWKLRGVLVLLTVVLGLAVIEWFVSLEHAPGPLAGIALVALLCASGWAVRRSHDVAMTACASALHAIVELAIGVVIVSALAVPLALLLPQPLVSRLMQDDVATDALVFAILGVGMLVATRGWLRYSQQLLHSTQSELRAQRALMQEEKARAEVLERDRALAQSELMLLRAQVEPHFLWNTLANVQYLTRKDPEGAHEMVGHLIRYLRASLPQMRSATTTLASEIESVRAYLALMTSRMGPRLEVRVSVSRDVQERPFPPLMLQTLVENAVKHGIEPKVGQALLEIKAGAQPSGALYIEVMDNGVGLQPNPETRGTGLGLRGIRERLQALYNGKGQLDISQNEAGGVTARIEIPE